MKLTKLHIVLFAMALLAFASCVRDEYNIIIGEWFDVRVEGNVMEVAIAPNDDAAHRELKVTPQAGNAFYTFWFKQEGASVAY